MSRVLFEVGVEIRIRLSQWQVPKVARSQLCFDCQDILSIKALCVGEARVTLTRIGRTRESALRLVDHETLPMCFTCI